MEHTKAELGAGAGGATGPPEPRIDKKARFADGDLGDLGPRAGTRIMGLPADVMVTVFGLLDLKTLVMVVPSVSSTASP